MAGGRFLIHHVMPASLFPYGSKLSVGLECCDGVVVSNFVFGREQSSVDFCKANSSCFQGNVDCVLLEVHGSENGGEELDILFEFASRFSKGESNEQGGSLVVIIHRPEEFILRTAHTKQMSVSEAKELLSSKLCDVGHVVLLLETAIEDLGYSTMLPGRVSAIPHGAFAAQEVSLEDWRVSKDSVVFVGSRTTWGEMRNVSDVLSLVEEVNTQNPELKVVGYAAGSFDKRICLDDFEKDSRYLVLKNSVILEASPFPSEQSFREWVWKTGAGRVIVRPDSFEGSEYQQLTLWEGQCVDFNVQMYHENPDLAYLREDPKAPKYEASGTLHQGKAEIFIVSDSPCMRQDVSGREGYQMLFVPFCDRVFNYASAASEIAGVIKSPAHRLTMLESNFQVSLSLGMKEVASRYLQLMRSLVSGAKLA